MKQVYAIDINWNVQMYGTESQAVKADSATNKYVPYWMVRRIEGVTLQGQIQRDMSSPSQMVKHNKTD